ncbi:MAG: tripartite tricarboxylate transporter TctB family protein [Negativicutes bacterium]
MDADRMIAVVCGLIGAFWAFNGAYSFGLWVNNGPGPGFLPAIIGIATCGLSILRLIRKDIEKAEPVDKKAMIPIAAIIGFVLCIYVIGFLATTFLFIAAWVVTQGLYSYKFSLVLAAIVTFSIWGIFEWWLQVQFPSGLINF